MQVHNLPPSGISPEMGELVGDIIGEFVEVVKNRDGRCVGQYLRVRVMLDIPKPLCRSVQLRLGNGGPVL